MRRKSYIIVLIVLVGFLSNVSSSIVNELSKDELNNGKETKFTQNKRKPTQHKHLTNKHDMKTKKRDNKIRKIQSYQNHGYGYGYEDNYQSYYGNDLKPVHGHSGYSDSSSLDDVDVESLFVLIFFYWIILLLAGVPANPTPSFPSIQTQAPSPFFLP